MLNYYRFKLVSDLFAQGHAEEARLELAALQRHYVSLCDENTTLKMQAQEYEDILHLANNLYREGEFYWLVTGNIRQGPFCPGCYEHDGLLMRLGGEHEERFCVACRRVFAPSRDPAASMLAAQGGGSAEYLHDPDMERPKAKIIPFLKM